jgi:hypothetical protein
MTQIMIENKSYVLLPEKEYKSLQRKAALKSKTEKTLSITQARQYSKGIIRKWAEGK